MELIIDGAQLNKKTELHETIARQLDAPDYYGENLDALWDLLTEQTEPLQIKVYVTERMMSKLSTYGKAVLDLFQEAEEANESITVEIKLL